MKNQFEQFNQDPERQRVYEQESLAFEATEVISDLMLRQNVNKSELAKRIGRSKAYVTQLLSGSRNMTLHTFADLAFALGHRIEMSPASLNSVRAPREEVLPAPRSQLALAQVWVTVGQSQVATPQWKSQGTCFSPILPRYSINGVA